MIKNILVPIDISAETGSTSAIAMAQDLAKSNDGKLTLLNIVQQFTGYTSAYLPEDYYEKARTDAADRLKEIAATHGLADTVDVVVREGTAATEILNQARDTKADIIVIASHDPGLSDYFLGSVAGRVVRHAHCSVLVVRETK
jgi:nucleotide-binding universal stress UspA family protein